ncbi:hypothetical protein [Dysgonomonas sp. 520]|uniref:hypothetical protein n=1 Tax=Dysgonomonas sp. 520 TaxID=2302931 RepID=UPI0013D3B62D|nr:hypothetical protein [Dysgonomonas sp. 520]NDW10989.1 hypothetical protein [Dysgonomonas sp. 520]
MLMVINGVIKNLYRSKRFNKKKNNNPHKISDVPVPKLKQTTTLDFSKDNSSSTSWINGVNVATS